MRDHEPKVAITPDVLSVNVLPVKLLLLLRFPMYTAPPVAAELPVACSPDASAPKTATNIAPPRSALFRSVDSPWRSQSGAET